MNELIRMIAKLNGGNLLTGQENSEVEKNLSSDVAKLYIDRFDHKYYFFAEYLVDGAKDNWEQIQKDTIDNDEAFGEEKPKPSDSYLILLWRVDRIEPNIYSKIIDIEENEFFYKKYVLYYTQEEYKALKEWLEENENLTIEKVLAVLAHEAEEMTLYGKLLVRIITKIPFWHLNFPSAELDDFESIVDMEIARMRSSSKNEVQELRTVIDKGPKDAEALADVIFSEYLKEWC